MDSYLRVTKLPGGNLAPADEPSEEYIRGLSLNGYYLCKIVQPRNYKFHKRYFALLNFSYSYWEPDTMHNGIPVSKNFDRFREDIQIAAGHSEMIAGVDGSIRIVSKSISWDKMTEHKFHILYASVFNSCWELVMSKVAGMTEQEMETIVPRMLKFE